MNLHIDRHGNRNIRLTKTEIKTLKRAQRILGDLFRFDASLVERMDNWGASGLAELLELPFCQQGQDKQVSKTAYTDSDFEVQPPVSQ